MESYGISLKHTLILERYIRLPDWTSSNIGTLVYDITTKRCYLGGLTSWELVGLDTNIIKNNHLFTDDAITGSEYAISALNIPIILNDPTILEGINYDDSFYSYDTTSNVQFTLDAVSRGCYVDGGFTLELESVDSETLDLTSNFSDTLIVNDIGGNHHSISEYLRKLLDRDSGSIYLDLHSFGYVIGMEAETINDVLRKIEKYIDGFEARDITNTLSGVPDVCDVQSTFNYFELLHQEFEFIKLNDVPDEYHIDPLYALKSTGSDCEWGESTSDNIQIEMPDFLNPQQSNVSDSVTYPVRVFDSSSQTIISLNDTFDISKIQYTPSGYYSTSLQHGLNLICELKCIDDALEAMICETFPIVGSDAQFEKTTETEQLKGDELCCPITENDEDEDWSYILNGWIKFSHGRESSNQPYEPPSGFVYTMTPDDDGIMTASDSHSHNGRISHNAYDCFEFEVTVSSETTDNDMIGIVIAWYVDDSGHEHTLSAWRSHGTVEPYTGVWDGNGPYYPGPDYYDPPPDYAGTHTQWALVYNYRQFTEWLVRDAGSSMVQAATDDQWTPGGGWAGDFSRIRVRRMLDQITVSATDWNTESPFIGTMSINLDSDPRLHKFKGPKQYGYGQHSTEGATWARQVIDCLNCGSSNCRVTNEGGYSYVDANSASEVASWKSTLPNEPVILNIHDVSEQTVWVWEPVNSEWIPYDLMLPCGGDNPMEIPCGGSDVRKVYDIRDDSVWEWDGNLCIWQEVICGEWPELEANKIYYNEITCNMFMRTCTNGWTPLN